MMEFQQGVAFEPADIFAMKRALQRASRALAFAFTSGEADETTQTVLARSIIELASTGVRSPMLLSAFALQELPPVEAAYLRQARAA